MYYRTASIVFALLIVAPRAGAEAADFATQVRPIFAANCYKCHAGDKHKGGLKLDSAADILKGGKDDPAVTPGDITKSDLYQRVSAAADSDERMPPKGQMLNKNQTDLIKQWIVEGAKFGDWKADAVAPTAAPAADADSPFPPVAAADPAAISSLTQSGAMAMPVAKNTNFLDVEMQLAGDKITDAQLALLAPVAQQVFWLNLAGTKVSDDGLSALEPLGNLRKLHVENTHISDAGLVHLKGLGNLTYLNLYGDDVTDAGIAQLAGLKNLRELYVWQTKVTPAGAEALQKSIPELKVNLGGEPVSQR